MPPRCLPSLLLLPLFACGGVDGPVAREEPDAVPFGFAADDLADGVAGVAAVEPGDHDGDWVLGLGGGRFEVRSPAGMDLSALDGDLVVAEQPEEGDLLVRDADGPVYLATTVGPEAVDDAFGHTTLAWGRSLEVHARDDGRVAVFSVLARGDDDVVELIPGRPQVLEIDGAAWRVEVLVATRTRRADGAREDAFAVEMLRGE